eukprot:g469.t1
MDRRPKSQRGRKKKHVRATRDSSTARKKKIDGGDTTVTSALSSRNIMHSSKEDDSTKKRESPVKSAPDPIGQLKAQVKRRNALWQQVLQNIALVKQEVPPLEEWKKKLHEISSLRKIAQDVAQKLQQNAAEYMLLKSSHQAELTAARKRLAVLSADLAASQDARVASDERIAKLAKQLTEARLKESDALRSCENIRTDLSSLSKEAEEKEDEKKGMLESLEKLRGEIATHREMIKRETQKSARLENVVRETQVKLAEQESKASEEKSELSRHVVNISTESKALKVQVVALKGDLREAREETKTQLDAAGRTESKLRGAMNSAKVAYEKSIAEAREKQEVLAEEIDKLRANEGERDREIRTQLDENKAMVAMLQKQLKKVTGECASEKRQRRELETKLQSESQKSTSTIAGLKAELATAEDEYFGETEGLKDALEAAKKKSEVHENQTLQLSSALKQSKKDKQLLEKRVDALTNASQQSELLLEKKGAELTQLRREMQDRIVVASNRENDALVREEKAKNAIGTLTKRLASATAQLAAERDARSRSEKQQATAVASARELSDKLHLTKKELSTALQQIQAKSRALDAQIRATAEAQHASDAALAEAKRAASKEVKKLKDGLDAQSALVATTEREKADLLEQIERAASRAGVDLQNRRKLEQQLNASRASCKKQEEALEAKRRAAEEANRLQKQQAAMLEIERREQRRETQKLRRALDEVRQAFKKSQKKAAEQVSTFSERLEAANKERDSEKQRRLELKREVKAKDDLIGGAAVEVEKWRKKHRAVEQRAAAEEARLRQQLKNAEVVKISVQRQVHELSTKVADMEKSSTHNEAALETAKHRVHLLERQLATSTATTAALEEKLEAGKTAKLERDQLGKELAAVRLVMQQERASRETADQMARVATENSQLEIQRLRKELHRQEASNKAMAEKEFATEKRFQEMSSMSKIKIEQLKARVVTEQERYDCKVEQLEKHLQDQERQLKDERLMRRSEQAEANEIAAKLRQDVENMHQKISSTHSELVQERTEHDDSKRKIDELRERVEKSREAKRSSDQRAMDAERAGMKVAKKLAEQKKERSELTRVWKAVEQKLVGRVATLQADLKGCRAKAAWHEDQGKVAEEENLRLVEETREKLKQSVAQISALRDQLRKSHNAQSHLKKSATATIESLRRDLSELTSRSQDEINSMNREKQALLATQAHLRTQIEHTQSEKQRALGLAAQRATAVKKAERLALEARKLAARQQEQNRRALDAFDRAQGTAKEKNARVALWKQQLQSTEERAKELENLLRELRSDHLRVVEDLKSSRSTIVELRNAAKRHSALLTNGDEQDEDDVGDRDRERRRREGSRHEVRSDSKDDFESHLRRWNRLLAEEEGENTEKRSKADGARNETANNTKGSIRAVDTFLDRKRAVAAHMFAREAMARDAMMDDDNDDGADRPRPRSSEETIRSHKSKRKGARPSSSRRRFSGSSAPDSSKGSRPLSRSSRPGSRRSTSSRERLPMVAQRHRTSARQNSADKGRAFDELISTPPVRQGNHSNAFDDLISTPKRKSRDSDDARPSIRRGEFESGSASPKKEKGRPSFGAFQSLEELEYVS